MCWLPFKVKQRLRGSCPGQTFMITTMVFLSFLKSLGFDTDLLWQNVTFQRFRDSFDVDENERFPTETCLRSGVFGTMGLYTKRSPLTKTLWIFTLQKGPPFFLFLIDQNTLGKRKWEFYCKFKLIYLPLKINFESIYFIVFRLLFTKAECGHQEMVYENPDTVFYHSEKTTRNFTTVSERYNKFIYDAPFLSFSLDTWTVHNNDRDKRLN